MPSPSKISTVLYSTASTTLSSCNPFSSSPDASGSSGTIGDDKHNNDPASSSSQTSHNHRRRRTSLLPTLAAQFEWAPQQQCNPYQAVIGRGDAAAYLSPPGFTAWTWWLPSWIATNPHGPQSLLSSGGDGDDVGDDDENRLWYRHLLFMWRGTMVRHHSWKMNRKSQPSEVSMRAVKDLVSLVQQQVARAEEDNESSSDHDQHCPQERSTCHQPPPPSVPPHQQEMIPVSQPSSGLPDSADCELPACNTAAAVQALPKNSAALSRSSAPNPLVSPVSSIRIGASCCSPNSQNYSNNLPSSGSDNYDGAPPVPGHDHLDQNTHAEMASRLAEGTLRAYRDSQLDEAAELHAALHFWTVRWERPGLAWLEAGPRAWFARRAKGGEGEGRGPEYRAGQKVSQIQAELVRRCAVIGEIQHHIMRAHWQKGVAEWGMLGSGIGGEWTSVVGEFGGTDDPAHPPSSGGGGDRNQQHNGFDLFAVGTNVSKSPERSIVADRESLVTWSIDAMRVIRDQLYRATCSARNMAKLPFAEHWPKERDYFRRDGGGGTESAAKGCTLPSWASYVGGWSPFTDDVSRSDAADVNDGVSSLVISDMGQLTREVTALLQSIEIHLEQQRARHLCRLLPPSRFRRNWYLVALGMPLGSYMAYKLLKEAPYLIRTCMTQISDIYRNHVAEPLNAIYKELFTRTGRIDVTDRKARMDAMESLKRMIRSWLDEYFPDMALEEKTQRAQAMDISLIEEQFEKSIKSIYEINSVVRMSLIEMQFIKKELLSALVSMDELMGSNEMNMQIAAMTPAVILLMAMKRGFEVLFYACFKFGKSKEEIYSSFRQTILDIERLLLMRHNPPLPPEALEWGRPEPNTAILSSNNNKQRKHQKRQPTLSAEDLGMLLLHIHECRSILWQSRRRFRSDVLRNVAEDLAELAGERGPVSVDQQLQIISRMTRTYPFMKVVSSGVPFEMIIPGRG